MASGDGVLAVSSSESSSLSTRVSGKGSCVCGVQYGLMLLYRYCCRSWERPGGAMTLGRSSGDGVQSSRRIDNWISSLTEQLELEDSWHVR